MPNIRAPRSLQSCAAAEPMAPRAPVIHGSSLQDMGEKRTLHTDDDYIVSLLDVGERVDGDPCTEPRKRHTRSLDVAQCLWLATQRVQWDLDEPKLKTHQETRGRCARVSHSANVPSKLNPRSLPVPHTCAPIHAFAGRPVSSNASTTSPEKSRPGVRGVVTKGKIPKTAAASDLLHETSGTEGS